MRIMILKEDTRIVRARDREGNDIYHEGNPAYLLDERLIYLDISDEDAYAKAALSVLNMRFGPIKPRFELVEPPLPDPLPFTEEEFRALDPKSPEFEEKAKLVDESREARRFREETLKTQAAIRDCLVRGDGRLAIAILESRRHLPGENYEVEYVLDQYPSSTQGV